MFVSACLSECYLIISDPMGHSRPNFVWTRNHHQKVLSKIIFNLLFVNAEITLLRLFVTIAILFIDISVL